MLTLSLSACPIVGSKSFEDFEHSTHQIADFLSAKGGYECVEISSSLESCGGCASLGQGKDCTKIPNSGGVGCYGGQCVILSCEAGYSLCTSVDVRSKAADNVLTWPCLCSHERTILPEEEPACWRSEQVRQHVRAQRSRACAESLPTALIDLPFRPLGRSPQLFGHNSLVIIYPHVTPHHEVRIPLVQPAIRNPNYDRCHVDVKAEPVLFTVIRNLSLSLLPQ